MKSLRDFNSSLERRNFLENELNTTLEEFSSPNFSDGEVSGKNIENLIGCVQIPLGVAGPVKISNFSGQISKIYVPLATTEGALVASVSRGLKAVYDSGGAKVFVENAGITRAPIFKTDGIEHAQKVKAWINNNLKKLQQVCNNTSSHLMVLKTDFLISGRNLFARISFDSSDAMGMNMATIAAEGITKTIEKHTGAKCISLSGNLEVDKKPAWINSILGRGKKVWAEAVIKKDIARAILKTTPEKITEVCYRKNLVGSALSGSLGFNAHFANITAAIFAATGQDLGQVCEGSLGISNAEILDNGDLYFSIYLPSLEVGTVGGGTSLPSQKKALEMMGVLGSGNVIKFSQIVGACVLAGELSLISSQAEGSLAKAHVNLARKGEKG